MPPPKIVIAAGGTGGHLIPAQALAQQLVERGGKVVFAGAGLESSPYFDRHLYAYEQIPAATFSRFLTLHRCPANLCKLL